MLQRRKNQGIRTYIAFIDSEKACDRVPHRHLLNKIFDSGIRGKLYNLIQNIYTDNSLRLRNNKSLSEKNLYLKGVRQGCPASPTLFNRYIKNSFYKMKGIKVAGLPYKLRTLLFADDTVILADSPQQLQENFVLLDKWCDRNKMRVNANKCGVMKLLDEFGEDFEYKIGVENIQTVTEYSYLGVILHKTLELNITYV